MTTTTDTTRATTGTDASERTYTCASCEVTWTSYDSACWMCGRDAATDAFADPTRAPRNVVNVGTPSVGNPADLRAAILRAHAMGLPDPRYRARSRA